MVAAPQEGFAFSETACRREAILQARTAGERGAGGLVRSLHEVNKPKKSLGRPSSVLINSSYYQR